MVDRFGAARKAVYQALHDGISVPVYAGTAPQRAEYPYVTIDQFDVSDASGLTAPRDRLFVNLTVWSTKRGHSEVGAILELIQQTLHRKRLPMDEGCMVKMTIRSRVTRPDADGESFMGTVVAEAVLQN